MSSAYVKEGGGEGLKIMGIRYLGYGEVIAKEKVVGIYCVTIASVIWENGLGGGILLPTTMAATI